jgi:hypothetical protein
MALFSKNLEYYYPSNSSKVDISSTLPTEYNNNNIYKISREIINKETIKRPNRLSIFSLFCSISFASLRDIYLEMENTPLPQSFSNDFTNTNTKNSQCIATCLIIPHYYTESALNNKYHISEFNISKIITDSFNYGNRAASTKNSKNWLICVNCLENRQSSMIKKGKCPVCGNNRKKIVKIDPSLIGQMKYNLVNDIRFYYFYFPMLIRFMSVVTDFLKNDPVIRGDYLDRFKSYENQIIYSKSTYLRRNTYQMRHYDTTNASNKKSHTLTESELLNTKVIDNDYINTLSFLASDPSNTGTIDKLIVILLKFKYPHEFIMKKIEFDGLNAIKLRLIELARSEVNLKQLTKNT